MSHSHQLVAPGKILELHNLLQFSGRTPTIEWVEKSEGLSHECIWISTILVDGQEKGTGYARSKKESRNIAAGLALANLDLEGPNNNVPGN